MTRRAIPARRKGHCCQGQRKDKAIHQEPKKDLRYVEEALGATGMQ
jgi:hypothetical protein